jgi:hypothetical protein
MVLWHPAQLPTAKAVPAAECTGLFVCFHVVKWHPEFPQSVARI